MESYNQSSVKIGRKQFGAIKANEIKSKEV
jgi:hypothetical protein